MYMISCCSDQKDNTYTLEVIVSFFFRFAVTIIEIDIMIVRTLISIIRATTPTATPTITMLFDAVGLEVGIEALTEGSGNQIELASSDMAWVVVTGERWICATSGTRATQSGGVSAKVSLISIASRNSKLNGRETKISTI